MSKIIAKERRGEFLGGTVQTVPHVTDEIKYNVIKAAEENNSDIVITEIGGTIGDIESDPFIEAIRQLKREVGRENIADKFGFDSLFFQKTLDKISSNLNNISIK